MRATLSTDIVQKGPSYELFVVSAACLSVNAGGIAVTPRLFWPNESSGSLYHSLDSAMAQRISFGHEHLKAEVFIPHNAPRPSLGASAGGDYDEL